MLATGCAVLGGVVGALLPSWIARLPEPPATAKQASDEVKQPYAEMARTPRLRVVLASVTALLSGLVAIAVGFSPVLPALLYLTAVGVLLFYVDGRVRLLPSAVILPSYLVVLALLLLASLIAGDWYAMLSAIGCGIGLWLLFAIAHFIYPPGVGFGDVRLIGLLGLGLGWLGVTFAIVGLFLAFFSSGLISLLMVIGRRATLKSLVPFGPFLVIGFILAVLFADDLVAWYLGL